MQKQTLIAVSILLCSGIASAEDTVPSVMPTNTKTAPVVAPAATPASDSSAMPKEEWLKTIGPMLPALICKGFVNDPDLKQQLDTNKMSYDKCVNVMPESIDKCQNQLYTSIPQKITNEAASTWGKTLGECIGKDFAMKYLLPQ